MGDDQLLWYVIWSNQRQMWWRPARRGYTRIVEVAGRYSYDEARMIVAEATLDGTLVRNDHDWTTGQELTYVDEVLLLAPEDTPPWPTP